MEPQSSSCESGSSPGSLAQELARWQKQLARHYRRSAFKISLFQSMTSSPIMKNFEWLYTRTTFQHTEEWPPMPVGEKFDNYEQMFSEGNEFVEGARVLLLGEAGLGKSFTAKKITFDWTQRVENRIQNREAQQDCKFLDNFCLLFYVDLRRCSQSATLQELLVSEFRFEGKIDPIVDYVKANSAKCFFVFDSWDEFSKEMVDIGRIADCQVFQQSTLLVTSRFIDSSQLPCYVDKTCFLHGFSEKQVWEHMAKLGQDNKQNLMGLHEENVHDLWTKPFILNFLCLLYPKSKHTDTNITGLMVEILEYLMQEKNKDRQNETWSNETNILSINKEALLLQGKIALEGLIADSQKSQTLFSRTDIVKAAGEKLLEVGLFQREDSVECPDPLQPSFSFGHKAIQEMLAAIYCVHTPEGLCQLMEKLSSLVVVHNFQLLLWLVCGLSKVKGLQVIEKTLELTEQNLHRCCMWGKMPNVKEQQTPEAKYENCTLGKDCPTFCWAGWQEHDFRWVDLHTRPAIDVTPFILQCLLEIEKPNQHKSCETFPYRDSPKMPDPIQKLRPILNFERVPFEKVVSLVQSKKVEFSEGNIVQMYNISDAVGSDEASSALVESLLTCQRHIVDVQNVHQTGKHLFINRFVAKLTNLIKFYMTRIKVPQEVFRDLLQVLSSKQELRVFYLRLVDVFNCEDQLCKTLGSLKKLQFIYLRNILLDRFESQLCQVVAGKQCLERLDLTNTNMSACRMEIVTALKGCHGLRELRLDNSNLSAEQVEGICEILSDFQPGLVTLGLSGNPLPTAVPKLLLALPTMKALLELDISRCGLENTHIVEIFTKAPEGIVVLFTHGMWSENALTCISHMLSNHQLPNLRFLQIQTQHVEATFRQKLAEMCRGIGVSLIEDGNIHGQLRLELAEQIRSIQAQYDKFTAYRLTQAEPAS